MRIVINNLSFGSIIKDLSITIEQGITGFFGDNGSGKTTLALLIAGLLKPEKGRITIENESSPVTGISFEIPQDGLFLDKVYDEISFGIQKYKLPSERIDKVISYFGFDKEIPCQELSLSEKKMLSLASLSYDPELLIIDEPLLAIDKENEKKVVPFLKRLGQKSKILLLFSCKNPSLSRLCTNIGILEEGNITFYGKREEYKPLLVK